MESINPKVMAAISAAIGAYLEEEAAAVKVSVAETATSAAPYAPINIWAIAGRQDAMFTRRIWQMRIY
ncbi:MAG TPA: hypothetical protein VFG29_13125 [Syntrophales bacterium]|nr:hypothetical protein [Syntrophales bacterium]